MHPINLGAVIGIFALVAVTLSILTVPQKTDPTPSASLIPAESITRQARF